MSYVYSGFLVYSYKLLFFRFPDMQCKTVISKIRDQTLNADNDDKEHKVNKIIHTKVNDNSYSTKNWEHGQSAPEE